MNEVTIHPGAPKPDHVPDDLVYDFDFILGEDYLRDPYACAIRVMEEAPAIFWTPRNRGHWVISSYDAISAAARDWETFSSVIMPKEALEALLANMPKDMPTPMTAIPANVDPPAHTSYRHPINVAFSPKVASGLKEEIRNLAVDLIEGVRSAGRCELVSEVTELLPVEMFLKLFGLPLERLAEYRGIIKQVMNTQVHDIGAMIRSAQLLIQTFSGTLIERRDKPRDDIISAMWKLEIDGKPMTLELMQSFGLTLFLAGLDTVTNAMALGTRHLAMHPGLQAELRADPKKIPLATEELLRLYSISLPIRTVAHDAEFQGVQMKKGEYVHFLSLSANRDPARFEDPNSFSLDRKEKAHLTFGMGPHRCLGMHLARVELHVYYEELLSRLPAFRLDPDRRTTFHGGVTMGPNEVHLIWS